MNSIELFSLLIPFRKSDSIWLNGVLILYSFSKISDLAVSAAWKTKEITGTGL